MEDNLKKESYDIKSYDIKSCSVDGVVVYKDRAEVRRNVFLTLEPGDNQVLLTGLSASIDSDSIRVEGRGDAIILDVIYETKEEEDSEIEVKREEGNGLKEELVEKKKELAALEFQQSLIERQKNILNEFASHVTGGGWDKKKEDSDGVFPSTVQPHAVSGVIEFMGRYEERMSSLDERGLELASKKKKMAEEVNVLKAKLDNITSSCEGKETKRCVRVVLHSSERVDATLIVSYVVTDASWTPLYDIRVFTKDKTLNVHYYGMIKQSTGEDWDNASISLSTAQPDVGGSPPSLGVHHIGFMRSRYVTTSRKLRGRGGGFGGKMKKADYNYRSYCGVDEFESYEGGLGELRGRVSLVKGIMKENMETSMTRGELLDSREESLEVEVSKVDTGQLYNASFSIPRTCTIPSDNTEHKVTVGILDMSPDFSYVSVPRLSPSSFLQAAVRNTSPYALLAGPANVFLDNNFLTKSNLPSTSPNEEFTISLGVDETIRITCQPMSIVRGTTGRIAKNNHLIYTFVYTVKNTQANVVKVKVMEQIPTSSDEKLKVVVQQPELKKQKVQVPFPYGYSLLNEDSNVEWHCTIPPDASADLRLVYTLDFPPYDLVMGLPNN